MDPNKTPRWKVSDDGGAVIVHIEGPFLYAEFICDDSQSRHLSGCMLTDYFTQTAKGYDEPLRTSLARYFDAPTLAAIEAAIRQGSAAA